MRQQLLILLILFPISSVTSAQLTVWPTEPIVNQETLITVDSALQPSRIEAIYRPGSRVSEKEELGLTTQDQLRWRPREAGLIGLRAQGPRGQITVRCCRRGVVPPRPDVPRPPATSAC